jgi:16S rRNA C1402 N4-methylase RsmH
MLQKSLTSLAHEALKTTLRPGCLAIDATAGNGNDTLYLAQQTGPTGHVFAFDVQQAAIDATRKLVSRYIDCSPVSLYLTGHEYMKTALPEEIVGNVRGIMFNLGYLPNGSKSIITEAQTTLTALNCALNFLHNEGILSVICYPGHHGGDLEAKAVIDWSANLNRESYRVSTIHSRSSHGPVLHLIKYL